MVVLKINTYFVFQSSLEMNSENYLKDISEIKSLMNKSSRFISLSGLSGIMAGIYALIGAGYFYVSNKNNIIEIDKENLIPITLTIIIVGLLSIITTIIITSKRASITEQKAWSITTKNLVIAFSTTLIIGLVYIIFLLIQDQYKQALALLLIFYGLALVHASKHTNNIVKPLGIIEISLGLICALFPKYSFWFWVLGFGIVHVIYGAIIYFKYDKK